MLIVDNLNLNQNQLQNVLAQVLSSAPASPLAGQFYYNSVNNAMYVYNGTQWMVVDATLATGIPNSALATNPLNRANHTGTQLAATISNLATTVQAYTLDTFAPPVASVNLNSNKIINLASPTLSTDAVNKSYVDTNIQSSAAGIVSKQAVAVVMTTNMTTLSGLSAIDGVTPTLGTRVLLVGQTTNTQNGVYIAASGAWTRSANDANNELDLGATWFVEQGTVNASTTWRLATPVSGTITPGTTGVTITVLTAAQTYTASLGVQLTGNNFTANIGSGLTLSGNTIVADKTVVTGKYAQTIGDGSSLVYSLTHNLNTLNVVISVRLISTGEQVLANNNATGVNTCSVTFATAPASNSYQVTVLG